MLTIAGFDPSSGAGITADLAVFAAHRLFGVSAITALTVQNTLGVQSTHAVDAATLARTLAALQDDFALDGVKIGMLATEANVAAVIDFARELRQREPGVPIVLDPVIRSSSGHELLDAGGVDRMRRELLPLVDWVTPNLEELAVLTACRVNDAASMEAAAKALAERYGGLNVVATGGHLSRADDLLVMADGVEWLRGEKIESLSTHGTGCAFSSALLAGLVGGQGGVEACRSAKNYVARAILRAQPLGKGRGPMQLYWPLYEAVTPGLSEPAADSRNRGEGR